MTLPAGMLSVPAVKARHADNMKTDKTDNQTASASQNRGECEECGHPMKEGDETHYPECNQTASSMPETPTKGHMNTNTLESEIERARWFRIGQAHRREGVPCCYTNGSYLDGWYAPDTRIPPSLTEQQMIENNI